MMDKAAVLTMCTASWNLGLEHDTNADDGIWGISPKMREKNPND